MEGEREGKKERERRKNRRKGTRVKKEPGKMDIFHFPWGTI
jgi:hypothetical protein